MTRLWKRSKRERRFSAASSAYFSLRSPLPRARLCRRLKPTAGRSPLKRKASATARSSALRTKNFPNLAVHPRCILRGLIDHLQPLLVSVVEFGLSQQVRGLHDGFNVIAEIVR